MDAQITMVKFTAPETNFKSRSVWRDESVGMPVISIGKQLNLVNRFATFFSLLEIASSVYAILRRFFSNNCL